jgi:hypothetical protein
MVSLPLSPDSTLHARDLATALSADVVIHFRPETGMFEPYVLGAYQGAGFELRGGAGYILTGASDTTATFGGQGWWDEEPPPPLPLALRDSTQAARNSAAVLAIAGHLLQKVRGGSVPVQGDYRVETRNLRTSAICVAALDPEGGRFSSAFVDFTNRRPSEVGDTLLVRVQRPDRSCLDAEARYVIQAEDIKRYYARLGAITLSLAPSLTLVENAAPNPFQGATTIRYQLASSSKVQMSIFSVDGRLVKKLIDANMPAGYYDMEWRGENAAGHRVGAGVYFYRFRAGGYESQHKMIILK